MTSTDLWTRKSTKSDDRIMRLASGTSKDSGGDVAAKLTLGLLFFFRLFRTTRGRARVTRDRAESAFKTVQHRKQLGI